jgi:diphosphoinositol-polyphosphate diphosphatase
MAFQYTSSAAVLDQTTGTSKDEYPAICINPEMMVDEKEAGNIGTKLHPACKSEEMREKAMSADELQNLCFSKDFSLIEAQLDAIPVLTSASFASHSTSTSSKKSMYSSCATDDDVDAVLGQLMEKSLSINSRVTSITVSRHGRSHQRWIVDSQTNQVIRLVTGCVPILKGGKVMLVSANKKNEWIAPKGGWEMDEEAEFSAGREAFEEAGVIGVLGPKLSEIQYETRKSRERRLVLEENLKTNTETESQFSSGWSDFSQLSEDDHLLDKDHSSKSHDATEVIPDTLKKSKVQVTIQPPVLGKGLNIPHAQDKKVAQLVPLDKQVDPKDHITSETTLDYSHVRVSLFPLYVQEVKSDWPESGRLRRAVDIDEAIDLLEGRPEVRAILVELKEKGMHRV